MPIFLYRAIEDSSGRERSGEVEAPQREQAILKLRARRLHPFEVEPARAGGRWTDRWSGARWLRPAWRRERLHFTRQAAALLRAGVPLITALELMARQDHASGWRELLSRLAESLRNGRSFSTALGEEAGVFDQRDVSMIRAGEVAGRLDQCLDRLAALQEKAEKLQRRVQAATLYPAVVTVVAVGIMVALMVFVIPRFEAVFAGLLQGQSLPALTRAVIGVARFFQDHGGAVAVAAGGLAIAANLARRTPRGRLGWDCALLGLPVVGDLCLKAAIARFARTLGALLSAGVPILSALDIAQAATGNQRVAAVLRKARDRVEAGEPLSAPLLAAGLFPPLMTGLIQVGEETGGLPEMLDHVADAYDTEVDRAADTFTALLEPALIVGMAGAVGTVVAALFLPIVKVIQTMG
jgi:type IV pilus assembly protein PilC